VKLTDRNSLAESLASVSPLQLLDGKSGDLPTEFLHGMTDPVIPISQSMEMAERLRKMGQAVMKYCMLGVNYGFDSKNIVSLTEVVVYYTQPE
jgi:predicted esterase